MKPDTTPTTEKIVGVVQPRLVRLSWRKEQVRYGPLTHRLSQGGEWLAIVQKNNAGLWFWYGGGRNTCDAPTDLATAKKDAKAHILSLANAEVRHGAKDADLD